jgi:hypothetical protein
MGVFLVTDLLVCGLCLACVNKSEDSKAMDYPSAVGVFVALPFIYGISRSIGFWGIASGVVIVIYVCLRVITRDYFSLELKRVNSQL